MVFKTNSKNKKKAAHSVQNALRINPQFEKPFIFIFICLRKSLARTHTTVHQIFLFLFFDIFLPLQYFSLFVEARHVILILFSILSFYFFATASGENGKVTKKRGKVRDIIGVNVSEECLFNFLFQLVSFSLF